MTAILLLSLAVTQPPKPPLDKDGQPDYEAALNDLLSKGTTPEKNANVLLWKALGPNPEGGADMPAEFFRRLGVPAPPKQGDYIIDISKFARDHLKLPPNGLTAFFDQQGQAMRRPWTAAEFPQIAAWVKANEKPLAVAMEATKRPDYYNPLVTRKSETGTGSLIGALLPSVQKCREVGALFTARAMLRAGESKFDDAWQDLLAAHRLGRLVTRGGTLIEALVGIAIDAIASNATVAYIEKANLTAAQLRDRLKDFQALPPMPPMADKLDTGERHFFLDSLQMIQKGGFGALEGLAGKQGEKLNPEQQKAWAKLDWSPVVKTGNMWYDRMGAAMRLKTRAERAAAFDKIDAELMALKKNAPGGGNLAALRDPTKAGPEVVKSIGDILIGLLVPAIRKVQDAEDRATQFDRNMRVAIALAVYRKENGQYPMALDALAPKILAAVPGDVFSGGAMIYRREGAGYVAYSVGLNGKDDGGRWTEDTPPGDDPRVRMPTPQRKR